MSDVFLMGGNTQPSYNLGVGNGTHGQNTYLRLIIEEVLLNNILE